jgi:hypothetical protein
VSVYLSEKKDFPNFRDKLIADFLKIGYANGWGSAELISICQCRERKPAFIKAGFFKPTCFYPICPYTKTEIRKLSLSKGLFIDRTKSEHFCIQRAAA